MKTNCRRPAIPVVLLTVCMAWVFSPVVDAAVIPLVNADFESPGSFILEWDGTPDVPGWEAGGVNIDSGTAQFAEDGASRGWSGVLNSSDEGVYQTTTHTIGAGDVFTFSFEAVRSIFVFDQSDFVASLYYVDALNDRVFLTSQQIEPPPQVWGGFSFNYTLDQPAAVGRSLGILFDNVTAAGGIDLYFDNVSLSVTAVPEPGSIAMFAIAFGSLLMIRRRARR